MQLDFSFFIHIIRETIFVLPEAEEKLCHGTPGFYAGKAIFARIQDDLHSIAIYNKRKEDLLATNPEVYFTTPHFDGYDYILVRLAKVNPDELKDLLVEGWLSRATKRAIKVYNNSNMNNT